MADLTLRLGDCLDEMRGIAPGSVDLIFTSPPYNLGTTTGGGLNSKGKWQSPALMHGYTSHTDDMPQAAYIGWQKAVLGACWETLSPTGAIFYNHKPRVQNGMLFTPLDLNPGLPVRQIVIWKRPGGINFSPTFYLPTHEWIVIFAKPGFRLRDKEASGAKDVWEVPHERGNAHPAPFPVALPMIALQTTPPGLTMDPFLGSGSTGVACVRMDRAFIGIEKDAAYFAAARARIEDAQTAELPW